MNDKITKEKIEKYFSVTKQALSMVENNMDRKRIEQAKDFYDMASRYYSDAQHFFDSDDYVNAFAALNYAHGWLDCAARLGIFDVHDSELFTVD